MTTDQERKEECRHEVRRYLADRAALAFRAATIQQKLNLEHDFTLGEVRASLVFLVSAKQVEIRPDALGSTEYFQITASGTLAHERGQ